MIKAVIIDDEAKAIAILKNKLDRYCPQINVICSTQKPKEAKTLIETLQPDLIFLDVAMPLLNGFDVLKSVENPTFEVIFVTAFDSYAIDAINHCAIGYIVKPVDTEDLIKAVNKAQESIENKSALLKNKQLIENIGIQSFKGKKIVVPSQEGLEFAKIEDIIHCEGVDGYTKIYILNKKPLLSSQSIGHFNLLLKSKDFYLVHKSHLVNINYIDKYLNEGSLILKNNTAVPVSRSKRSDFLNSIKET